MVDLVVVYVQLAGVVPATSKGSSMAFVEATVAAIRRCVSTLVAMASLTAAALLVSGCADKPGGPIPYNVSDFGVPDSTAAAPLGADYKIAPMEFLL